MADVVNLMQNAENVEVSPLQNGYSGVRIVVGTNDDGETVEYSAGNLNGNVLEIKNPFGTQQMAVNILNDIRGYQYQPMDVKGALLNPAAEMGDGISVNGIYTGLYIRSTTFGRLMKADIGAPTNQEIEHEFTVESPSDRQYTRFVQQTKSMLKITNLAIQAEVAARTEADEEINSTLTIQASQISAKVSKTGGNQSSFGWVLDDSSHTWYAGNRQVMRVTSSGLEVTGKITATSGQIGGFTIGTNSIYSNGMSSMSSTQTTGVHVGTDGIKLGQNFKVDTSGNVTANNITATGIKLKGNISFYNSDGTLAGTMTAANLREGAKYSYDNHGTWSTGSGYGFNYNSATQVGTNNYPGYFRTASLRADTIYFGTATLGKVSKSFKDGDGNTVYLNYVSYSAYG